MRPRSASGTPASRGATSTRWLSIPNNLSRIRAGGGAMAAWIASLPTASRVRYAGFRIQDSGLRIEDAPLWRVSAMAAVVGSDVAAFR